MTKDRYAPVQVMEMALREALAPLGLDAHLEVRKMFGGAGFYVNGLIFAAWFGKDGQLALKLPAELQDALLRFEGAERAEMKQYVHTPAAFVDNPKLLEVWVKKKRGLREFAGGSEGEVKERTGLPLQMIIQKGVIITCKVDLFLFS